MMSSTYFWRKGEETQNFGDYLTEFFMSELFYPLGEPGATAFLIGSVIDDLFVPAPKSAATGQPPVVFWGCGMRNPEGLSAERWPSASFAAVRGPLSASNLRLGSSVPQGDPALLLPALYTPRAAPEAANRTVCIPHFHDLRTDDELRRLSGCDVVLRPNLRPHLNELRAFIDTIAAADFVLSAAMHGAIVAAAYGRPFAFWNNGHIDLPFKWQEIAALFNIPAVFCRTLDEAVPHYQTVIKPALRIPSPATLLTTAPFVLKPSALLKVVRHELANGLSEDSLAKFDEVIGQFERRSHQTDATIARIVGHIAALERSRETLRQTEAELANLHQELARLRHETETWRNEELAKLQHELAELRRSAASERETLALANATLRSEGEKLRNQVREARVNAASERETLEQANAALGRENDRLRKREALELAGVAARAESERLRNQELASLKRLLAEQSEIAASEREVAALAGVALASREQELGQLHATVRLYESSASFKMTWPLRLVAQRCPWLGRNGRRALALSWYLGTAQFGRIARILSRSSKRRKGESDAPLALPIAAPAAVAEEPSAEHAATLLVAAESSAEHAAAPLVPAELSTEDAATPAIPAESSTEKAATLLFDEPIASNRPFAVIIDGIYPRPDADSGSVDAINLVCALRDLGYEVAFLPTAEFDVSTPYRTALEALGVLCPQAERYPTINDFLQVAGPHIDVCILSRVYAGGAFMETVRRTCSRAKVIFNTVDLHHLREERQARLTGDRTALNRALWTREREIALMRLADATVVVSKKENQLLEDAFPGNPVFTIPLARDHVESGRDYEERSGIGFIGSYLHPPNVDAVNHFLDDIWPLVRAQLPGVEFFAMGADMPDSLRQRTDPGFVPVGHVSDLAAAFDKLRVVVAPLRVGAGAKGKVASALAHGLPCVASSIAAEGMGLIDGMNIAIADTCDAFAARVVALYSDREAWQGLSDGGRALAKQSFSLAANEKRIAEMLTAIGLALPAYDRGQAKGGAFQAEANAA